MKTFARESCRAEIARRLRTVGPDTPRRWGKMTAHQMICHLTDSCRMALGRKAVSPIDVPLPRPLMKWVGLHTPLPWPKGILTSPELDQHCDGTRPAAFASDLEELVALVDEIARQRPDSVWPVHPAFGKMSRAEWMRWAYMHADHHLRQFGA